ncbi:MAG: hypothetical protein J6V05_03340, partial [Alistipes sp.]|nr:hypothetical protein [Alistipes sp.]
QGGGDEPEPETPDYNALNWVRAKQTGSLGDANIQIYSENDEYCLVLNMYGIISGDKYIPEGTYEFGNSYGAVYCYNYSYLYDYATSSKALKFEEGYGQCVVSEVDGKYRIEVIEAKPYDVTTTFSAVYEGTIENLIVPSEYVAPVQIEFTPVRGEYDNKMELYEYNEGDSEYAFWLYDENNNYLEVICKFGPHTNWDYVYEASYVAVDGTKMEFATVQTQAPSSYNCSSDAEKYFAVKATMPDNSYIMFYDVLPAVEVNYLGEGSTYAPGSDNGGGVTPEPEPEPEPSETVELAIVNHGFGFTGTMETEVIFMEATPGVQHIIDFRMTGIEAGSYTDADGSIIIGYSLYMAGSSDYNGGVALSSANATIVDNGDTTFTFDVNFVADGAAYHFTYTTPAQEVNDDVTTVQLVSKGAGEQIGQYAYGCLLSDAEGNNQVKIAVDQYYSWDSATDFPKANDFATWQSSPSYITQGSHFSFVNKTLMVNGVTYANDEVSNAKLTVVEATSITIEFTVGGEDYKFVYSAF